MLFTIVEQLNETHGSFICLNDDNTIKVFSDKEKANEERIYLQPDYDNLLKVIGMK